MNIRVGKRRDPRNLWIAGMLIVGGLAAMYDALFSVTYHARRCRGITVDQYTGASMLL